MLFFYLHFKKYFPNSRFFFNFDAAKSWKLEFQDSATAIMTSVADFNPDKIIANIATGIAAVSFVLWMLIVLFVDEDSYD